MDAAKKQLQSDLVELIDKKLDKIDNENLILVEETDRLKIELMGCVNEIKHMKEEICALQSAVRENCLLSNDNEQYSRRSNIRIFNVPEHDDENSTVRNRQHPAGS